MDSSSSDQPGGGKQFTAAGAVASPQSGCLVSPATRRAPRRLSNVTFAAPDVPNGGTSDTGPSPPSGVSFSSSIAHRRSTVANGASPLIPQPPQKFLYDKPSTMQMQRGDHYVTTRYAANVRVGIGWDHRNIAQHSDLDASAICFNREGKKLDHVSFGRRLSRDLSVYHCGDDKGHDKIGEDEAVALNLQALSADVVYVIILLNVYTAGRSFDDVCNVFVKVTDFNFANQNFNNSVELLKYSFTPQGPKQTGAAMVVFVRERIGAVGAGAQGHMAASGGDGATKSIRSPLAQSAPQSGGGVTVASPRQTAVENNKPDFLQTFLLQQQQQQTLQPEQDPTFRLGTSNQQNSRATATVASHDAGQPVGTSSATAASRARRLSMAASQSMSPSSNSSGGNLTMVQTPSSNAQFRIIALGAPINGKSHRHVTSECEALCVKLAKGWLPVRQGKFRVGGEQSDVLSQSRKLLQIARRRTAALGVLANLDDSDSSRRGSEVSAFSQQLRSTTNGGVDDGVVSDGEWADEENDDDAIRRRHEAVDGRANQRPADGRSASAGGESDVSDSEAGTETPSDSAVDSLEKFYVYTPSPYVPHVASPQASQSSGRSGPARNSAVSPPGARPRVVRKAVQEYSVGHTAGKRRALGDEEEDESGAVDAALLAAAIPAFDAHGVVRYDQRCYNIGTDLDRLLRHFLEHRSAYELHIIERAAQRAALQQQQSGTTTEGGNTAIDDDRYLVDFVWDALNGAADEDEGLMDPERRRDRLRQPPPEMALMLAQQASRAQAAYFHRLQHTRFHSGDTPPPQGHGGTSSATSGSRSPSPNDADKPFPPPPSNLKNGKARQKRTRGGVSGAPQRGGGANKPRGHQISAGALRKPNAAPGLFQMLAGQSPTSATGRRLSPATARADRLGAYRDGAPTARSRRSSPSASTSHGSRSHPDPFAVFGGRDANIAAQEERDALMRRLGVGSSSLLSKELERWIATFLRAERVRRDIVDPLGRQTTTGHSHAGRRRSSPSTVAELGRNLFPPSTGGPISPRTSAPPTSGAMSLPSAGDGPSTVRLPPV